MLLSPIRSLAPEDTATNKEEAEEAWTVELAPEAMALVWRAALAGACSLERAALLLMMRDI